MLTSRGVARLSQRANLVRRANAALFSTAPQILKAAQAPVASRQQKPKAIPSTSAGPFFPFFNDVSTSPNALFSRKKPVLMPQSPRLTLAP